MGFTKKILIYLVTSTFLFLLFLPISRAQNIDSLLTIWQQEDATPSTRLDAINQLLSNKSFCKENINYVGELALNQYNLAKKYGTTIDIINALRNRIYIARQALQFEKVLVLVEESLAIDIERTKITKIGEILFHKGVALHKMGRHKEARVVYNNILSMEGVPDDILLFTYQSLSMSLSITGDCSKAIEFQKKSYQFIEHAKNNDCKKSLYYNNLAIIYFRMEDMNGAIENLNKAMAYQKLCGEDFRLLIQLSNLVTAYIVKKEYDLAKVCVDSAFVLTKKYKNGFLILKNKLSLAQIYVGKGLLKKAEQILSDIANIISGAKSYVIVGRYYLILGEFNLAKRQYKKAVEACQKGYTLFSENNFLYNKKLCAKCLYDANAKRKNTKEELKWYKEYHTIKDAIITVDAKDQINQLEFDNKYREKKIDYEKNILRLTHKIEQEEKDNFFIFLLWLATLPIIILALWIYDSEKKKSALLTENLKHKTLIAEQAEKLKEQEKLKTDFFANISHEFQTPLTIISGQSANLLTNEEIPQKDRFTISSIVRNASNLLNLTKQILVGTKSNDWKIKRTIVQCYLYEILNPIIKESKIIANEKKLQLDLNYNGTAELLLITDSGKLRTIISNLISNAIRYSTYKGTVTVNCQVKKEQLQIKFKDNGIGIPKEKLPHIFDRFVQVADSENIKEHRGGFGLGLSICKEYAQLLGGNITVESTLNVGSSFCLTIPRRLDSEKTVIKGIVQNQLETSNSFAPNLVDKIFISEDLATILIVEDNKDIWGYLQNLLADKYNLIFTSNGVEALTYLENAPIPNLIITDLMMPYMDGLSLIESLKKSTAYNFVPILVLTIRNDVENKIKGLNLNRDDYMVKPFDNNIFIARVNYLLCLSKSNLEDIIALKKRKIDITQKEQDWLNKVEEIVRDSLSDSNFTSAKVASEMALSKTHLNRKLKSLIGFTASKYILEARLRKALELLDTGAVDSVKEVCYKVGFKEPKYFSLNFKERFGKNPSEFIK